MIATNWFCNIDSALTVVLSITQQCYLISKSVMWPVDENLADDIYFFQAILIDLIISNTPGKFGKKILTIYGTVQHFIIFPKHFYYK